ncbi:helix-turn-helix transcriptional regulator [Nonomuraea sp. ATR24]|uniref:helix-turn-helix transcriptional regulator n=1 Tax=Nonomuraea sp. ATR24 TaxID=1676744 RepID=UPI0035BED926
MPDPITPRLAELRRQFGQRLRELREGRGLTQEQLGELAEVDRKTINRIENGMYSPHLDKLFQIADALSIPPRDLFEWDGVSRPADYHIGSGHARFPREHQRGKAAVGPRRTTDAASATEDLPTTASRDPARALRHQHSHPSDRRQACGWATG